MGFTLYFLDNGVLVSNAPFLKYLVLTGRMLHYPHLCLMKLELNPMTISTYSKIEEIMSYHYCYVVTSVSMCSFWVAVQVVCMWYNLSFTDVQLYSSLLLVHPELTCFPLQHLCTIY